MTYWQDISSIHWSVWVGFIIVMFWISLAMLKAHYDEVLDREDKAYGKEETF